MNNVLSMDDFSKLHAHLVVPLIVADLLEGREQFDEEARYGLHDALSEIDPDSALLAIALASQHIAARFMASIPVAVAVKFEAEKILHEYGPDWLSNYYGGPVDEQALFGMLQTLPEDLEALADLMDALRSSIVMDSLSRDLCEILSIQARAHMDVAEYILGELDKAIFDESDVEPQMIMAAAPQHTAQAIDNVIPFSAYKTRQ